MSAEAYREEEPEVINVKRNPYLVDYEQQRRLRERRTHGAQGTHGVSRKSSHRSRTDDWEREISRDSRQEMSGDDRRTGASDWDQGEQRSSRQAREAQVPDWGQEIRRSSRQTRGVQMPDWGREIRRSSRQGQEEQGAARQAREAQVSDWGREEQGSSRQARGAQASDWGREEQRSARQARGVQVSDWSREEQRSARQARGVQAPDWGREIRRRPREEQYGRRSSCQMQGTGRSPQRIREAGQRGRAVAEIPMEQRRPETREQQERRAAIERKRAALRRKRVVRMQRMMLFAGVFCLVLLCGILLMKRMDEEVKEPKGIQQPVTADADKPENDNTSSGTTQGMDAVIFARHPEWEENFLTPNEYSRPGDALEEVKNIFVHYTANPKTSAAQNRSYFEQLKDTHITSASAHFIIGYNGEIIQCIPLDEIAYAVQTRNFDSVSIECCYKSADGSFTQETYDSLIELLAWLTDAYDLTSEDILRHYDCGGKKCPVYYTEHEDAWEILKKDVAEKL